MFRSDFFFRLFSSSMYPFFHTGCRCFSIRRFDVGYPMLQISRWDYMDVFYDVIPVFCNLLPTVDIPPWIVHMAKGQ